jgi:hypothetical protein
MILGLRDGKQRWYKGTVQTTGDPRKIQSRTADLTAEKVCRPGRSVKSTPGPDAVTGS